MATYKTHSGFTLIEMMITIAVLAILVTVGIPSFQETIDKRRLTGAAEQLYGDLQYARGEAIKRNANVFVNFTASGSSWCYGISTGTCDCTATSGSTVCQLDTVTKVVNQDGFRNVTLSQAITGNNLNFEPRRGMVSKNNNAAPIGTGTVTFTSGSSKQLQLDIRTLGRVKICSPSGTANVAGYGVCS